MDIFHNKPSRRAHGRLALANCREMNALGRGPMAMRAWQWAALNLSSYSIFGRHRPNSVCSRAVGFALLYSVTVLVSLVNEIRRLFGRSSLQTSARSSGHIFTSRNQVTWKKLLRREIRTVSAVAVKLHPTYTHVDDEMSHVGSISVWGS